ncbi:MAG: Butyrate kinase [Firmicutes bacterium]|nr:Butyrate kinase [Bacillota bacterium]MDI6705963.1 butyrate kinase [Bacillota bacterium]
MKETYRILAVNPGSTSTKIAVYDNEQPVFEEVLRHPVEEIKKYAAICDQFGFRKEVIVNTLKEKKISLDSLDAVVGRGGNMKPVEGGTYKVNPQMVEDLKVGVMGQHASNLGGVIAFDIANQLGLEAFVVDPVVVDEFEDLARVSGMPEIQRKSKDHPLNQKAAARQAASELGGEYSQFNFIVGHLGGGISVGIHRKGRIIDVNNALDGDGPFSPERTGGLPVGSLIDMCYSGKYTKEELRKKIVGGGGLVAYLGTNDGREVQKMIKAGDQKARLIYEAMAYQIAKEIGAGATVLKGEVDAIILTGGLAYDDELMNWIKERVGFIARVMVYPGEFEMLAMVQGVLRVFRGQEEVKIYK